MTPIEVNPLTTPLDTEQQVIDRIEEMGGTLVHYPHRKTWVVSFPPRVQKALGLRPLNEQGVGSEVALASSPLAPGLLEICRLGG